MANVSDLCDVVGEVSLGEYIHEIDVVELECFNSVIDFTTSVVGNATACAVFEDDAWCVCGNERIEL